MADLQTNEAAKQTGNAIDRQLICKQPIAEHRLTPVSLVMLKLVTSY